MALRGIGPPDSSRGSVRPNPGTSWPVTGACAAAFPTVSPVSPAAGRALRRRRRRPHDERLECRD